jgi:periplasmic protein TonB
VNSIRFSLVLSVAGHATCLTLLILFLSDNALPVPQPIAKSGVEVVFQPELPKSEAVPLPQPALQLETPPPTAETAPPEPQAEVIPPPPEAPAVVSEPIPPAPEAAVSASESTPPPSPPRKTMVKKAPKPVLHHEEPLPPTQTSPIPPLTPPVAATPPLTASAATPVPARVPSPDASAGYRALLSAWLESHKRYPDAARERGEEGNAVLRFEVDRNGRVIAYTVAKSSGHPDLDESVEAMMRGASLPPFPAEMPQPRMEVSVTIRFSLRR